MPGCEHLVSYRNGHQVMVGGLKLRDMGYCRGAHVEVTDAGGSPNNAPWSFVVSNDEHATLVSRNPPPPNWIQRGVRVRIEVQPPALAVELERGSRETVSSSAPDGATARVSAPPFLPQPRPGFPPRIIYAVDVGAPGNGLAWARLAPHLESIPRGSTDFELFLDLIARDLRAGLPVALGFEAPLFLPVAAAIGDLTRARRNEPGPWSFGPGAYVTTISIPLMALTLRHVRSEIDPPPRVILDAEQWLAPDSNLLLWEAFVWGPAHAREPNAAGLRVDIQDAATAVRAFVAWESRDSLESHQATSVTATDPISLVGAAVIWAGLDTDSELLHQQTIVLRPTRAMGTDVVAYAHIEEESSP